MSTQESQYYVGSSYCDFSRFSFYNLGTWGTDVPPTPVVMDNGVAVAADPPGTRGVDVADGGGPSAMLTILTLVSCASRAPSWVLEKPSCTTITAAVPGAPCTVPKIAI